MIQMLSSGRGVTSQMHILLLLLRFKKYGGAGSWGGCTHLVSEAVMFAHSLAAALVLGSF